MFGKESIWIRELEKTRRTLFSDLVIDLARDLRRLPIEKNYIRNDVLVIGQGEAFPERLFVCSPETEYTGLRKGVNSLTCIDPDYFTDPSNYFELPVQTLVPGDALQLQTASLFFFSASAQRVLPTIPNNSFDAAMMFRVPRLYKQFEEGLLQEVIKVLKPKGRFIFSGSFADTNITVPEMVEIEAASVLPQNLYPFSPQHVGFILRKK